MYFILPSARLKLQILSEMIYQKYTLKLLLYIKVKGLYMDSSYRDNTTVYVSNSIPGVFGLEILICRSYKVSVTCAH